MRAWLIRTRRSTSVMVITANISGPDDRGNLHVAPLIRNHRLHPSHKCDAPRARLPCARIQSACVAGGAAVRRLVSARDLRYGKAVRSFERRGCDRAPESALPQ